MKMKGINVKIIKFCNKYIRNERKKVYLYTIISLFISLLSLGSTLITGKFVDTLIDNKNLILVKRYCIAFAIISLIIIIFSLIKNYLYTLIQTKSAYQINKDVIEHIKKLPRKEYIEMNSSYFNQRINNDSNSIISFYLDVIVEPLTNIISGIVSITIIFVINKKIAAILILSCILYIVLYKIFRNKLYTSNYIYKEEQAEYFSKLNEQLEYIDFIKLHSLNRYFLSRLENIFIKFFATIKKYSKISIVFSGLDQIICVVAEILIYIFMAIDILNGKVSIGMFTIVMNYCGNSLQCIKYFLSFGKIYQENLVAYDRIDIILKKPIQKEGDYILKEINEIEINNLSYNIADRIILNKMHITMEKGKIYLIKGENGTGKTTCIRILMGMYSDEYSGEIKFNGINIKNVNMCEARKKNISITEQDATLINDTVLNNLRLLNLELQEKDIKEIAKFLNLKPRIDTNIFENNTNISGGERQKIAVCRQLLSNTEVMIFDEPTSAMDKESRKKMVQLMNLYKKDRIIIVISHDIEFDNIADEIITLE